MHELPLLDVVVLLAYTAGVVGLGCWFVRRSQTTDAFMAAGRRLPGWAVGLSIFGTYVSSISFLALPGKAYAANWNPFVFSLSLPLAAWLGVRFFVPYYRRLGNVSAYHALEARFGSWARLYAVACYLLTQVVRVGAILFLVALPLERLLGWDMRLIVLATGVLVTLYTLLGGIEAVIWTDVVQSLVLGAGALACALLLTFDMPQGPGQLFEIAAKHAKFSLGSFGPSLAEATFWVVLIYGLFMNLQNFGIDQSYVQRYLTARSDREARKSLWLGALLYLPISALFFFIGTALFAYFQARPGLLPEGLSADRVFPHFIVEGLPQGFTGLLIAAIFAAAMSSVDSSLNCSATLTLADLWKRHVRREASEREAMWVLRISTVFWGVLGTSIALALAVFHADESTLDLWWKLSGIFSGGMLGLFLLGLIARRAGNAAAAAGVACGLAVIAAMTFLRTPFHTFLVPAFGATSIVLVGCALGALTRAARGGDGSRA
ncbi:MAG TPA: sodium:solute symporter [Planctomycetota bacterium]|nr:sodium:solute symporter [Planctomycetota bacterium]HRR79611.1 sodium:solute symporter [Planctomycetota bacterium]HRT94685.1 sodium:solute symporter [Planctomycetota bacterium]